jgi:hypothetical protein
MPIFIVRDVFRLSDNLTVLACEGDGALSASVENIGTLSRQGEAGRPIRLLGERKMLNKSKPGNLRAFETLESIELSNEDAHSGLWTLLIEN